MPAQAAAALIGDDVEIEAGRHETGQDDLLSRKPSVPRRLFYGSGPKGIGLKRKSRLGRAASVQQLNALPRPPDCTSGTKIVWRGLRAIRSYPQSNRSPRRWQGGAGAGLRHRRGWLEILDFSNRVAA
jgi:hypothetical protein